MSIAIPRQFSQRDGATLIKMSRREWKAAAEAKLRELGLTYEELMQQAEDGNFISTAARRLWVIIGGSL